MDKELKARWVKALRGGKYKQGKGAMRPTVNSYCCFGVLRELISSDEDVFCAVRVNNPLAARDLILMNDGIGRRQHSFAEIADWIEANL